MQFRNFIGVSVWLVVGLVSQSLHASSRVGNGVLPSLEYICLPKEAIYRWCQDFESAEKITLSDFKEGVSSYVDPHGYSDRKSPDADIEVDRVGDLLSFTLNHLSLGAPLSFDYSFYEYVAVIHEADMDYRVVFRKNGARLLVRLEYRKPKHLYFMDFAYYSVPE